MWWTFLKLFKINVIVCVGFDEVDDWDRLEDWEDRKFSKKSSECWSFVSTLLWTKNLKYF